MQQIVVNFVLSSEGISTRVNTKQVKARHNRNVQVLNAKKNDAIEIEIDGTFLPGTAVRQNDEWLMPI